MRGTSCSRRRRRSPRECLRMKSAEGTAKETHRSGTADSSAGRSGSSSMLAVRLTPLRRKDGRTEPAMIERRSSCRESFALSVESSDGHLVEKRQRRTFSRSTIRLTFRSLPGDSCQESAARPMEALQ